jgi:hypothetical protein
VLLGDEKVVGVFVSFRAPLQLEHCIRSFHIKKSAEETFTLLSGFINLTYSIPK